MRLIGLGYQTVQMPVNSWVIAAANVEKHWLYSGRAICLRQLNFLLEITYRRRFTRLSCECVYLLQCFMRRQHEDESSCEQQQQTSDKILDNSDNDQKYVIIN